MIIIPVSRFFKNQYMGATLRVGLFAAMPCSGSLPPCSLPIAGGAASGISAAIPCAMAIRNYVKDRTLESKCSAPKNVAG